MNVTEDEYLELLKRPGVKKLKVIAAISEPVEEKKNKHGNHRVTRDGLKFQSELEARYYDDLVLLLKAKEIFGFCRQPRFPVGVGREYLADFIVWYIDRVEIIDCKGFETDVFKIKRDLFRELYPGLEIKIVR